MSGLARAAAAFVAVLAWVLTAAGWMAVGVTGVLFVLAFAQPAGGAASMAVSASGGTLALFVLGSAAKSLAEHGRRS